MPSGINPVHQEIADLKLIIIDETRSRNMAFAILNGYERSLLNDALEYLHGTRNVSGFRRSQFEEGRFGWLETAQLRITCELTRDLSQHANQERVAALLAALDSVEYARAI